MQQFADEEDEDGDEPFQGTLFDGRRPTEAYLRTPLDDEPLSTNLSTPETVNGDRNDATTNVRSDAVNYQRRKATESHLAETALTADLGKAYIHHSAIFERCTDRCI